MVPPITYRTERLLKRTAARRRPESRNQWQARDKKSTYERRHRSGKYARGMSQAHDNMKHRERDFARWLDWVASEKKRDEGWSTEETIGHSSIDRSTWYRWKKISRPGWMPKPATLDEFCSSLNLDPTVPYRILGWGRPSSPRPAPTPPSQPDLDLIIRRIELRLKQDPPTKERRALELRLVRARRARDAKKLADELEAEIREELGREETQEHP